MRYVPRTLPRSRRDLRPAIARPALLALLAAWLLPATGTPAQVPVAEPPPRGAALLGMELPAFTARTLEGREVSPADYRGLVFTLYVTAPDEDGQRVAQEAESFHGVAPAEEFAHLGVIVADPAATERFRATAGVQHDLVADPEGELAAALLPPGQRGLFLVDHQGRVRDFFPRIEAATRTVLRRTLRELAGEARKARAALPALEMPYRVTPRAPAFTGTDLAGVRHMVKEFAGRPLLVYFFEMDCQRCEESHRLLANLRRVYHPKGLQFLGVTTSDPDGSLKETAWAFGLDFPILLDGDGKVRTAFGATVGNPDIYWLDSAGGLRWRELGVPQNLEEILDLQARVLLGEADPVSIGIERYRGFRYCRVCHEPEFRDWLQTPHATGMASLPRRADLRNPECLPCHVTGFRRPGGYAGRDDAELANIQCEACHGPGGGHGRPEGTSSPPAGARCLVCHTGEFELKQPLPDSLALMDHRETPDMATLFASFPDRLPAAERVAFMRRLSLTPQRGALPVGSVRCRDCHASIYRAWEESAHRRALATLAAKGADGRPECLRCHVTAYGELGGWRGTGTPGLDGVGCEACHGPGGDHVTAPPELARLTIYGLAPRCATCLPEAVCRTCHDAQNDPDFALPEDPGAAVHPPRP